MSSCPSLPEKLKLFSSLNCPYLLKITIACCGDGEFSCFTNPVICSKVLGNVLPDNARNIIEIQDNNSSISRSIASWFIILWNCKHTEVTLLILKIISAQFFTGDCCFGGFWLGGGCGCCWVGFLWLVGFFCWFGFGGGVGGFLFLYIVEISRM